MIRARPLAGGEGLGPRLARAVVGSAGLRGASMVLSFAVGLVLARELGPGGYGVYALVMSVTALLTIPTEFGLPSLVTREVAGAHARGDWNRIRGVVSWATVVVGSLSLVMLLVVGLVLWLGGTDRTAGSMGAALLWGIVLIPLVALGNLRGATLRGLRKVVRGQLPEMLLRPGGFVVLLLLAVGVAGWSLDPAEAIALNVAAAAFAFLVGTLLLVRSLPEEYRRATRTREGRAWTASTLPLALTEGMRYLQVHVLVLMLGWFATSGEVGIYRIAGQTAVLVALPLSVLNLVIAPYVARFHAQEDRARMQRLVGSAAAAIFGGAVFISVPFLAFGKPLLEGVFGAEFGAGYAALVILCLGQLASSFLGANATLLNMTGLQGAVTRAFGASLALTLALGVALIPRYGMEGAAIASTAGLLGWNLILWRHARRTLRIDTSLLGAFASPRLR